MARPRHWLDPLARRLLQATGELPSPPKPLKPVAPLVLDTPPADTWQIDVNRASQSDWLKLPGCTNDQADLLVRLQRGGVQFSGADDLARLLELSAEQQQLWQLLMRKEMPYRQVSQQIRFGFPRQKLLCWKENTLLPHR